MIDIKADFGKEIEALWDKYSDAHEFFRRGFALPDRVKKNGTLFIGINPSFKEGYTQISHFYPQHKEGEKVHQYFNKFPLLSEEWTHWDLLFFRERNQNFARDCAYGEHSEFIDEQLKISQRIIEAASPSVIIVSNAFARDLLKGKIDFEFDWDTLGTEVIQNGHLKGTPVFFTSMLTGVRALDNGSFDRLKWHINFVLDKQKANSNV